MNLEIVGTGSCIPDQKVKNSAFATREFYNDKGQKIEQDPLLTIEKFEQITGIRERRYARADQQNSDLATIAAEKAIKDAGIDPETLDGIIMAHNFGDVPYGRPQTAQVPNLGTRVKFNLQIKNPDCIAFDVLYGCPGWIQSLIIANNYVRAGEGNRYLIIGAETLSRTLDPHDRDSMIFSDGAGATVVEGREGKQGILSTTSQTYTAKEAYYLYYDVTHGPEEEHRTRYIKMMGHKIFEFALTYVPGAMKKCLDKSGIDIGDVKKVLIHQANEKMDEAIIKRFYRLYKKSPPEGIMPMSIGYLGNSSVATVPTLLDLLRKGEMQGHVLHKGDVILMASVGAGMSINAVTYRM